VCFAYGHSNASKHTASTIIFHSFSCYVLEMEDPKPEQAKNGKNIFTDKIADEIVAACGSGFTLEKCAGLVGVPLGTIKTWCNRKPDFARRVESARKKHELSLLRDIELAGQRSWQAKAWLAERIYNHSIPSARLQVSGSVEHGMAGNLAQLLAGVASQRREKKAQVIETQEVKAIQNIQTGDDIQPIVTPILSNPGDALPLEKKTRHKAMRRRKPRAESLKNHPPTTTPPPAIPPPVSNT
jgi:hypothetical protein